MKNYILPNDQGKPAISIIHPENKTYNESRIILSISSNESLPWVVYSINDGPNVTIPLLTTSFTFSDGNYHLEIYGNDTMGNMAKTEVFFTINTKEATSLSYHGTSIELTTTSTTSTESIGFSWFFTIFLFPILIIWNKRSR